VEVLGLEVQTLKDCKWVAQQVKLSCRQDNLSFKHHVAVAPLPPREQKRWLKQAEINGWSASDLRGKLREERLHQAVPTPPPLTGSYRVLYADPPWDYGDKLVKGYGAAEHHYPSMPIEQICRLVLPEHDDDSAALFLWATSPLLPEAMLVIEQWGFRYKASFVWDKRKHNFGHYNSVRHELLLLATKGSCLPDSDKLPNSVMSIDRTKHAEELASLGLDHGDRRVTTNHYITIVDQFRLRLPLLWPRGLSNERQLLLF
jgi:hypothetical protein